MSKPPVRLGVVMDPIDSIKPVKDSTLAMLLAAQKRGWELRYMEQPDLWAEQGAVTANMRPITVQDDESDWYEMGKPEIGPLSSLNVVLMRKDPPFDMEYVYTTYLLELAEREGVLVVNKPQALRDANEKAFTAWFPQCTSPTLITRRRSEMRRFLDQQGKIVVKPMDGMGGRSIFVVDADDPNVSVILETITEDESRFAIAQGFIPEIAESGDLRILLIDGEPVPYGLARIPAEGESRGNLAAGATSEGRALNERDLWICGQVAEVCREKGMVFVGLDVIGDYLTEINVTSPTCIRELDGIYGLDIASQLMDTIEGRLA